MVHYEEMISSCITQFIKWEIIIADDGSTDGSLELCRTFERKYENIRVLSLIHGGKPSAIWGGIKEAKGETVLFTDIDQSTQIEELKKLTCWFDDGYDVIIGSRGAERDGFSVMRKTMSRCFRTLRSLFLLPDINDTQCGFKTMRTSLAKEIFPLLSFFSTGRKIEGWVVSAFDVELLFITQKWGFRIKEVPILWKNRDIRMTKAQRKAKFLYESIEMAKETLSILVNNARGKYNRPDDKN